MPQVETPSARLFGRGSPPGLPICRSDESQTLLPLRRSSSIHRLNMIAIDIGKTVFNRVGLNLRGEVALRKKFSRRQLLHFNKNLQVKLIVMEA